MARQNRVDPFSRFVTYPARGLFMGNRGRLHRDGQIRYNHNGNCWIICSTDFGGRRVEQWADRGYTPLFFHDEAVALAAGHRPCWECRRDRFNAFVDGWESAFGNKPTAATINVQLHAERVSGGVQRTHVLPWSSLPRGAFAVVGDEPVLVLEDSIVPWIRGDYGEPTVRPTTGSAIVLTPPSTVGVLAAGYVPVIAPEAGGSLTG